MPVFLLQLNSNIDSTEQLSEGKVLTATEGFIVPKQNQAMFLNVGMHYQQKW